MRLKVYTFALIGLLVVAGTALFFFIAKSSKYELAQKLIEVPRESLGAVRVSSTGIEEEMRVEVYLAGIEAVNHFRGLGLRSASLSSERERISRQIQQFGIVVPSQESEIEYLSGTLKNHKGWFSYVVVSDQGSHAILMQY